jgi:hypothetical protein
VLVYDADGQRSHNVTAGCLAGAPSHSIL